MALQEIIRNLGVRVSMIFDKKTAEEVHGSVNKISFGLKSLVLGFSEAAAGAFAFGAIAGSNSRALQQSSQALGINVERLQELQFAAKVAANVGTDELNGSLEGLAKTLFEARNNNVEASRTLIRMGVPLDLITNKTVGADQVMLSLADRFKGMPDGIYKTALANEVFGASGAKLIPLLNKGALGIANMGKEARGLGVVMGKGAVDAGAAFDRQLTKLWIVIKNLSYVLGTQLIKYLAPIVYQFERFFKENQKFIKSGIVAFVQSYAKYFKIFIELLKSGNDHFQQFIAKLGGAEKIFATIDKFLTALAVINIGKAIAAIVFGFTGLAITAAALIAPFAIIGATFWGLFYVLQKGHQFFTDLGNSIKEFIGNFASLESGMKYVGGVFDSLGNKISGITDKFEGAHEWINKSKTALTSFGNSTGATALLGNLTDKFGELKEAASGKVSGALASIGLVSPNEGTKPGEKNPSKTVVGGTEKLVQKKLEAPGASQASLPAPVGEPSSNQAQTLMSLFANKLQSFKTETAPKVGEPSSNQAQTLMSLFANKLQSFKTETAPKVGEPSSNQAQTLMSLFANKLQSFKTETAPKVATAVSSLTAPPGGVSAPIVNNNGNTTMNATINVSVPRGTEPLEATNIVSGGVQKGFHQILRQTRDQFLGGVAQ